MLATNLTTWTTEGESLKRIRNLLELNQKEFAARIQISQQLLSLYESGQRRIPETFSSAIAPLLDVQLSHDELAGGLSASTVAKLKSLATKNRLTRFDHAIADTSTPILQRLCNALGLSQSKLVANSGLHRFTASDAWNGKIQLKAADAAKIALALDISESDISSGLSRATISKLRKRVKAGTHLPKGHPMVLSGEEERVVLAMRRNPNFADIVVSRLDDLEDGAGGQDDIRD